MDGLILRPMAMFLRYGGGDGKNEAAGNENAGDV